MPSPQIALRRGLFGAATGITYLLRDEFTSGAAAPLASPRAAEPGPGSWTIVDTGSRLSVTGGRLRKNGVVTSWEDPRVYDPAAYARAAGRAMYVSGLGIRDMFGWRTAVTGADSSVAHSVYYDGTSLVRWLTVSGNAVNLGAFSEAQMAASQFAIVLRAGGGEILLGKGAQWGADWVILWVGTTGTTATLYPSLNFGLASVNEVLTSARVADLGGPFATDFGLATSRLAGTVAAGATFTHSADCVIEWTQTTLPPTTQRTEISFREVDSANRWYVRVDTSTGDLVLREIVGGGVTTRATAAGVVAAGHRIVIVADGAVIRGYSGGVLRWTYSSATNFQSATSGSRTTDANNVGIVTDLAAYPRTMSGDALTWLNRLAA